MSATRDYYEVLGVSRGAEDAEIKKAFRRLARELHRLKIPVFYYVSPQLWAWRQGRIKQGQAIVDGSHN